MLAFQAQVVTGLASAAGYVVLAVILFSRTKFKDWIAKITAIYILLSAAWSVGQALAVWQGLVPAAPLLGAEIAIDLMWVLPTLILILTLQFLERPGLKWAALLGGVWVALALLAGLNADLQDMLLRLRLGDTPQAALSTVRILSWASLTASALALTVTDYVRTKRPLHRNRIMFWLIALFLTQLGEGLMLIPPVILDTPQIGLSVRLLGVSLVITSETLTLIALIVRLGVRLLGVSLLMVAVTSYHLPNLRSAARRSVAGFLLTLVSGALYLGSFLLFQQVSEGQSAPSLIAIVAVGIALAVIQRPMLRAIQALLDRFLYSQQYDPAHALREYNAAISNILDLHLLVSVAVGIISEALEIRRGALLLITELPDGGTDVRVVSGMGEIEIDHFDLSANSPILAELRSGRQPLTQYEVDILPIYRSAPAAERTWLQALDMEVYVPIRSHSVLAGVFALGHKASGDAYTPTDFDVLVTLGDQTAVALQNARLVTDLKQANAAVTTLNDELTRTNRRLEKLDQAKTDFIEIASHELRTPLTQVRGYADILADSVREGDPSLPQIVQISQGIGRATIRLEEIITAMLDVSQIDSEALAIHRTPLTMMSVLRFALDNYNDAIKNRRQSLTIEGVEDLPPIQGDFQRLCQAIGNVVGNCIKYTPDGGKIAITGRTIGSGQAGESGTYVEMIVADSGIGIDPEDQELIFEKFYRVGPVELHSTGQTKFKGGGPGLGLPISKGVIQAHGGKIWVESEGQDETRYPGSKFHILLPAAPPSIVAEYNARSQATVAPFTTAP